MNQQIIDKFDRLSDEEIREFALNAHELTDSILSYFLKELEKRKMTDLASQVKQNHEKFLEELNSKPLNKPNAHFSANVVVLAFLAIGPLLDQLFNLSTFSRDPAPEMTVLFMNLLFCALYSVGLILFVKHYFWGKWISFSIYFLWTLLALLFAVEMRPNLLIYIEVIVRFSFLIYLISSHKWIMKLKENNN